MRQLHKNLKSRVRNRYQGSSDEGMATVEYALVTVGAAALAAVLVAIIKSSQVRDALWGIISSALGG